VVGRGFGLAAHAGHAKSASVTHTGVVENSSHGKLFPHAAVRIRVKIKDRFKFRVRVRVRSRVK